MIREVTLANKEDAIKAVMHERAVELCAEESSNLDILRWRERGYSSLMNHPKQDQSAKLPIPAKEISENPEIN